MEDKNNQQEPEFKPKHNIFVRILAIIGAAGLIALSVYLFKILELLK